MIKLIFSLFLVAGLFAEEDISYSISGRIDSEYTVKFITHFINHEKYCMTSNYHEEIIEIDSGEFNVSIPLSYVDKTNKCVDFKFRTLELKIIPKDLKDTYSLFPVSGDYAGAKMQRCLGDNNFTMEHMQQLRKEQTAPPIHSGFIKENREGYADFRSSAFLPKKYKTNKALFRLVPTTDFICDVKSKGLFSKKGLICILKTRLDTDGGLYHYTGENGEGCHALTHPDFGVEELKDDHLVINVIHENIDLSDSFINGWLR